MSGHSHWATIKHKKGATDAKRGRLWSKLSRAIIIAARHGTGVPGGRILKCRNARNLQPSGSAHTVARGRNGAGQVLE